MMGQETTEQEMTGQEMTEQETQQHSRAGNQTVDLIATGETVRISEYLPAEPLTLHAVGIADNKRRGEATEAEFVARATSLDLRVANPWGDSEPYDLLIGFGQGFWRLQVKRAPYLRHGQYVARAAGHSHIYTKHDIDFIAAHLVQENLWYLIPIEAFEGVTMLHFHPKLRSKAKYEKYREAWCLLDCDAKARGPKDIPLQCRCKALPTRCAVCPNRP